MRQNQEVESQNSQDIVMDGKKLDPCDTVELLNEYERYLP
jgi:hypothetical protein